MSNSTEVDALKERYSAAVDVIEALDRYLAADPEDDEYADAWDSLLAWRSEFRACLDRQRDRK